MVRFFSLFVFSVYLYVLLLLVIQGVSDDHKHKLVNVSKLEMFVDRLPDMPKLQGYSIKDGVHVAGNLTIGMYMKYWKFHRDLPRTRVFAFGNCKKSATVPGPTIESIRRVPTYVTWTNHLPSRHILPWDPPIPTAITASGVPTVVHLHGAVAPPTSDGHSLAWYTAGYRQVGPAFASSGGAHASYYPNAQLPGNLWYHDHAVGLTRVNLLAGLIGAYIIRSPDIETPLNLPSGDEFDRNLVIFDRSFTVNGSIYMPDVGNNPDIHPEWQPEYFGDAVVVNGKAWPYLAVRRRRYRFRILNASNARYYNLSFSNGLPFFVVGSDNNYLRKTVEADSFVLAPSEIADVIVNFAASKSASAVLCNSAPYPFPTGDSPDEFTGIVMKFLIRGKMKERDISNLPEKLLNFLAPSTIRPPTVIRYITMYEFNNPTNGEPTKLMLNFKPFDAPVTETPIAGSLEEWVVINLTEDDHPLHIHLAAVATMEQRGFERLEEFKDCVKVSKDPTACGAVERMANGKSVSVPEYEKCWKNVVKIKSGHGTRILLMFKPLDGDEYVFDPTVEPGYVYHCHILDHEDNEMMRPLKIVH